MSQENATPLYLLYVSSRDFNDALEAATENAHTDDERAQLWDIASRFRDEGADAQLSTEEHDLITRLADERQAIGPTDI